MNQYLITKRSLATGRDNTFLIWMTYSQWEEIQPLLNAELPDRWRIQAILPDHEFLISGTTSEERRMLSRREPIKA